MGVKKFDNQFSSLRSQISNIIRARSCALQKVNGMKRTKSKFFNLTLNEHLSVLNSWLFQQDIRRITELGLERIKQGKI